MRMKLHISYGLFAFMLMTTVILSGCKKEDSSVGTAAEREEFATAASESDAEAEVVFDDVFDNVMGVNDEVAMGGTGVFGTANKTSHFGEVIISQANRSDSTPPCVTVSVTYLNPGTVFPVKVVIDFGTGCIDHRGWTRKGKIITVYTNRLLVPGASTTTTFDGYYVNDIKVEGTHKVTNNSAQDKRSFTVVVSGAKLTKPNGNFSQWNSEKTITQSEGLGTPFYPLDDVFQITGAANGSVKRGDKFFQWSTAITDPLIKKFICRWIVQGAIALRKSNTQVAILNYGNGVCDNKATYSVNGQTIEITLH